MFGQISLKEIIKIKENLFPILGKRRMNPKTCWRKR